MSADGSARSRAGRGVDRALRQQTTTRLQTAVTSIAHAIVVGTGLMVGGALVVSIALVSHQSTQAGASRSWLATSQLSTAAPTPDGQAEVDALSSATGVATPNGSNVTSASDSASAPVIIARAENPDGELGSAAAPAGLRQHELEQRWRSGSLWLAAPSSLAQPTAEFAPGYPTAQSFLDAALGSNALGVRVVLSADPALNCGLGADGVETTAVAGCYNPAYGKVLFLWWGPGSVPQLRQLAVLREFASFSDWWDRFDLMYSAMQQNPAALRAAVDADAACQVVIGWSNRWASVPQEQSSAGCDLSGWTPSWLANRLTAEGVVTIGY